MFVVEKDKRKMREIKKKRKEREWVGREIKDKFILFFSTHSTNYEKRIRYGKLFFFFFYL